MNSKPYDSRAASPRALCLFLSLALLFASATLGLTTAFASDSAGQRASLEGTLRDAESGAPIEGALVVLPDLGRNVRSDAEGRFRFTRITPGTWLVGVHAEGYIAWHRTMALPSPKPLELELVRGGHHVEEITVAATPWSSHRLDVAASTGAVDGEEVRSLSSASLGEAVEALPGTRNVSTGDMAGKPMIRGRTNERVRVLSDGFLHAYQQFSLRHAPNIEPYDAERIEVVRGPASVLYGPDALGGVVNMVTGDLSSAPSGVFELGGSLLAGYDDLNEGSVGRGSLEGAYGGLGFEAAWTRRTADDTEVPSRTLPNTHYDQHSEHLGIGYAFTSGATISAHWQGWDSEFGFFLPPIPNFALRLGNEVARVEASVPVALGVVRLSVHRAENRREAYPGGFSGPNPVNLEIDTATERVELITNRRGARRGWLVVERTAQDNATRGFVGLLPNYENETWSAALYEEWRLSDEEGEGGWTLSGGLRYDERSLDTLPTTTRPDTADVSRRFSAMTGSLGVVRRFSERSSLALNVGRGWRPPSEYELFARGQHTGVAAFERGNIELVEESNLSADLSWRYEDARFRGEATLFVESVDDLVYAAATDEFMGGLPVVEYRQADADVEGLELFAAWRLNALFEVSAQFDAVDTENASTGRALPATPPDRLMLRLRYDTPMRRGAWHDLFVELGSESVARGEASGPDELFSREDTAGYTLVHLDAGVHRKIGGTDLGLALRVSNLLDKEYVAFLDTYKQWRAFDYLSPGRHVRLSVTLDF